MNKKQRHAALKTSFENAKNLLLDVFPIWMMNPLTVSESLPCVANLFDVVVFDESSQVPLEDAIPSVFRSKQLIVVGDDQQMPPSRFFASAQDEVKTILDQSMEVGPCEMLKWHYRSKHPNLIEFSNRTFYRNELVCLPPSINGQAVEVIHVDGNYQAGKNTNECKAIAKYYSALNASQFEKIAIICFLRNRKKQFEKSLRGCLSTRKDS